MRTTTIEMTPVERQVFIKHIRFASIQTSTKRQMALDRARGRLIGAKAKTRGANVRIEMTLEELGALVEAAGHIYPMGTERTRCIFERARYNLQIDLANAREAEEGEGA